MGWNGAFRRDDELATFERISDDASVVWASSKTAYLFHATVDGITAVCNKKRLVDLDREIYPSTIDRSNDMMTCVLCQERVRKKKSI